MKPKTITQLVEYIFEIIQSDLWRYSVTYVSGVQNFMSLFEKDPSLIFIG